MDQKQVAHIQSHNVTDPPGTVNSSSRWSLNSHLPLPVGAWPLLTEACTISLSRCQYSRLLLLPFGSPITSSDIFLSPNSMTSPPEAPCCCNGEVHPTLAPSWLFHGRRDACSSGPPTWLAEPLPPLRPFWTQLLYLRPSRCHIPSIVALDNYLFICLSNSIDLNPLKIQTVLFIFWFPSLP